MPYVTTTPLQTHADDGTVLWDPLTDYADTGPIAGGIKVGAIGDSYTAYGVQSTSVINAFRAIGYISWLRVLSNQNVTVSLSNIYATLLGEGTAEIIANGYHTQAAAAGLDFVCVCAGSNNYSGGHPLTYDQIVANLTTIYQKVLDSGAVVVAITIPPRSSLSAADYDLYSRVNSWIQYYATQVHRIIVVNPAPYLTVSTTGDYITNFDKGDGVQTSARGAYYIGLLIWNAILRYVAPRDNLFKWFVDTYDATKNPRGNLLVNGMMDGTAGTKGTTFGGGTVTGNVADSWTVDGSGAGASMAVACSKITRSDGINGTWQQMVISGTSPNTASINVLLSQIPSFTNIAVGDTVEGYAEFEVDSGHSNIMGVRLHCYWVGGDSLDSYDMHHDDPTYPTWLDTGTMVKGVLRTPPITVPAGSTASRFRVEVVLKQNVTVAATVRVGRVLYRKTSVI